MVVIGCGAGGGVPTQCLARAGWRAVAMDAGPFWDSDADWGSDVILQPPAVPNLWITDGSTLPTWGAANPALIIMAPVARAADVMVRRAGEGS